MQSPAAPPEAGCPARETLVDFHLGKLTADDLEVVGAHVSDCPRCEAILGELAQDDSIVDQVRQCLALPADASAGQVLLDAVAAALDPSTDAASTAPYRTAPGAEPAVGQRIGPYELLDVIGKGGMGTVYRARHVVLEHVVALKLLRSGVHTDPEAAARFYLEGKANARLVHPNIVRVYDFGEHDERLYYVMELAEGGSLSARLARQLPEPRQAAELVRTLALAVEYAHHKKVLHRDLKPSNVVLTTDGEPQVADFGLAMLLDEGAGPQTQTDVILGTPSYMAPEQAEGRRADMGPPTDVYALGAILYECLTGRPPFKDESKMAVLRQVRTDYPVAPTRRRPGIPKELEDICLRCLEKRPLRRYATAQGLADDLRRFLGGQRPDAARDRPRRMWRAWWKYVAVFALSLCLAGTAVALYLNDPERHLERVHRTLKEGRPVTLIGPTGAPKWFRWRTGEGSRTSLDQDGTFFVDTWSLALLELVVDPHQDRYRFSAWVRHRRGDLNGKVGIYVARQAYPWSPSEVHFFTPLTFDGLGSEADERAKVPPAIRDRLPPPRPNRAELAPHLRSDERRGDPINETMGRALGPGFPAGPEAEQPWRHLELTVTPERVTARWEGSPFAMTAADIQRGVDFQVADMRRRPRYRDDPFVQRLQPVFDVRGGLGLFIRRGAASFRDVEVTPIKEAD